MASKVLFYTVTLRKMKQKSTLKNHRKETQLYCRRPRHGAPESWGLTAGSGAQEQVGGPQGFSFSSGDLALGSRERKLCMHRSSPSYCLSQGRPRKALPRLQTGVLL